MFQQFASKIIIMNYVYDNFNYRKGSVMRYNIS